MAGGGCAGSCNAQSRACLGSRLDVRSAETTSASVVDAAHERFPRSCIVRLATASRPKRFVDSSSTCLAVARRGQTTIGENRSRESPPLDNMIYFDNTVEINYREA